MFSIPFLRPRLLLYGLLSLLGALTLLASVACGSASSPANPGSRTASPPSPTESLQAVDLGPLAVIDSLGGSLALGGTGPVHIEDDCVTMTLLVNGEILLLIWLANEVRWDDDDREITYSSTSDANAESLTIRDGDIITVGGESLLSDEPVTRNLVWLATPRETCSGERFIVNFVQAES